MCTSPYISNRLTFSPDIVTNGTLKSACIYSVHAYAVWRIWHTEIVGFDSGVPAPVCIVIYNTSCNEYYM